MAQIKKLSEIMNAKKGIELVFVSVQMDETRDGQPILRLILKENIPIVYGRQITDPVTQDRVRVEAPDVEMVSIGPDALAEIDKLEEAELAKPEGERKPLFVWTKEGEAGTLKSDALKLDVSNNQEVWVVKEGFAKFAANRRNEQRAAQRSSVVNRIRNQKTKEAFADTNTANTGNGKPEPVSETVKQD